MGLQERSLEVHQQACSIRHRKGLSWGVTGSLAGKDEVLGQARLQERDGLPQTCLSDGEHPMIPTGAPVPPCSAPRGVGGLSWDEVLPSRTQLCWDAAAVLDTAKPHR